MLRQVVDNLERPDPAPEAIARESTEPKRPSLGQAVQLDLHIVGHLDE